MNKYKIIYLLIGIGLLLFISQHVNIQEVLFHISLLGWSILLILAIYFCAFLVDSLSWQLILEKFRFNFSDTYHVWKIRMIGEAFNAATPFGTLGGEPVKAFLLKHQHAMGYKDAIASLILAKTTNMIGLTVFLTIGCILVIYSDLSRAYQVTAVTGLVIFGSAILIFFLIQRYKITTWTGNLLIRGRLREKLNNYIKHIHSMEDTLIEFYVTRLKIFIFALILSLINWHIGVLELFAIMYLLGVPITFEMAYIIEAGVQLVRVAAFLIPSALGAQEGIFVLLTAAITGDATIGLAAALTRRIREIVWIIWGVILGWQYIGKDSLTVMRNEVKY